MKKIALLTVLILGSTAYGNNTQYQCQKEIIDKTYSTYRADCGGPARKNNCQIQKFQIEGNLAIAESACAFSDAEEDYSSGIAADYIVDLRNCQFISEKIKECFEF